MDIFLILAASLIGLVGIAGSFLPAIPGAPLNFASLFFLYFIQRGSDPSPGTLIGFGILTAFSLAADYLLPARSVQRYGATRLGMAGAIFGGLIGLIILNLVGLFIGTFLGAVAGEMLAGKEIGSALKAGAAGVGGNVLAILYKLLLAIGMTAYFLVKVF